MPWINLGRWGVNRDRWHEGQRVPRFGGGTPLVFIMPRRDRYWS